LEIAFHTAELREICEKRETAASELGYAAARELAERLSDIDALDNVSDLCALLGPLVSDWSPTEKAIHLSAGWNIVFTSGHPSLQECAPKATDWTKTSRMKITAIEATNG
jgi:hypothetical protein